MMGRFGEAIAGLLCCALLCTAVSAGEQPRSVVVTAPASALRLTGNVETDLFGLRELGSAPQIGSEQEVSGRSRKSPWLAAGMSLVIPGAGEFYAESYWKAALFLALDVAAWGLAYHFDKKGDRQTNFFQNFADEHWSVVKYAQFSLEYFIPQERWGDYSGLIFRNDGRPWERVNWNILNRLERDISLTATGRYYSHTLPSYGEQQYYELIGKYPQYTPGWDDAELPYIYSESNVTPNFRYYAAERGKANDFYNTATTFVTIAIVTHVVSALDAAWSAGSYNRNIHASVRMQRVPTAYGFTHVAVARLEYAF